MAECIKLAAMCPGLPGLCMWSFNWGYSCRGVCCRRALKKASKGGHTADLASSRLTALLQYIDAAREMMWLIIRPMDQNRRMEINAPDPPPELLREKAEVTPALMDMLYMALDSVGAMSRALCRSC